MHELFDLCQGLPDRRHIRGPLPDRRDRNAIRTTRNHRTPCRRECTRRRQTAFWAAFGVRPACPGNRGLLRKEPAGVDLDKEETAVFLAEGELPKNVIGAGIRAKFDSLAMTEDIRLCRRNLRLLLRR